MQPHSDLYKRFVLGLATGLLLVGCAAPPAVPADRGLGEGRLGLVVSVGPQRYFAERVGGEHVRVSVMVGPGDSPHTYEPKPDQLKALSDAAVYFTVGVGFEDVWMGRITGANPAMRVVATAAGIERLPNADPHDGEGGLDTHVWTSPRLAAQQAGVMAAALSELDPAHAADYAANLAAFEADIAQLDADLRATLASAQGRQFMVFHPAWGYFARDYGLEQLAIEVGGQEPSAQELAQVITTARAAGIKVIFAQPQFSTVDVETIAREIGGQVVLVDPLSEDWLANMRAVADAFSQALAE